MDLSDQEARRRFATARTALLATISAGDQPDQSRPHLVPITFAISEDVLVTAVDHKPKKHRGLRRLANIHDHPRVSLLVDHYDDDWDQLWWVRADGLASILPPGAEPIDWLTAKYPQYQEQPPRGPVIRVEITRWVGWAASPAPEHGS